MRMNCVSHRLVSPGLLWVEDGRGDSGAGGRDGEVEHRELFGGDAEVSVERINSGEIVHSWKENENKIQTLSSVNGSLSLSDDVSHRTYPSLPRGLRR